MVSKKVKTTSLAFQPAPSPVLKIIETFCSLNIRTWSYGRGADIREFYKLQTVSVEKWLKNSLSPSYLTDNLTDHESSSDRANHFRKFVCGSCKGDHASWRTCTSMYESMSKVLWKVSSPCRSSSCLTNDYIWRYVCLMLTLRPKVGRVMYAISVQPQPESGFSALPAVHHVYLFSRWVKKKLYVFSSKVQWWQMSISPKKLLHATSMICLTIYYMQFWSSLEVKCWSTNHFASRFSNLEKGHPQGFRKYKVSVCRTSHCPKLRSKCVLRCSAAAVTLASEYSDCRTSLLTGAGVPARAT